MSHLKDTGFTYLQHLRHAWSVAFVLLVHGIIPNVWTTKASDIICSDNGGETGSTGVIKT